MSDVDDDYARLFALVDEARRVPREERDAWLGRACGDDTELIGEVRALLAAGEDDVLEDAFTESKVEGARRALDGVAEDALHVQDMSASWLPEEIGGYRILRKLGQGGMGIVYEAEQSSPHRRVAIKLLHPMHATPERLRRFRQEAAVLGRLQHPGIAQIFEAGTFDAGHGEQPFFAMELVEGVDIRTYCERGPGIERAARVELLARVADAVQYAHEHGVIHRDLKPDNVLVDEHGNPRILDFGIARASGTSVTLSTIITEEGQLVGTLAYMSPEQLEQATDAVTPRVDVYALGVLGFELLVGRLPREIADLSLSRAIVLLATSDAPRAGTLNVSLRGDLETILGKALESEPTRRYASAAALAGDLRRHLSHHAILARAPSRVYLARKFTRRHRGLVTGAFATLLTLLVGLAVALHLAGAEREQRGIAQKQTELARANEQRAIHGLFQAAGTLTTAGRPRDALRQLWLVPREMRGFTWWMLERQAPHVVDGEHGRWRFLDEDHLVIGGSYGVHVYSLLEQRVTRELFEDLDLTALLDATPSGLALAYSDADEDVLLLDFEREVVLDSLAIPLAEEDLPGHLFAPFKGIQAQVTFSRVRYPQVSDDGRTLLRFPSGDVAEVRRDGEQVHRVTDLSALETVRLGPDGQMLVVNRRDEVTVVDLATGALRLRYAFDPDQGAMGIPVRAGLLLRSTPDMLWGSGTIAARPWGVVRRVWRHVELPSAGRLLKLDDPLLSGWVDDELARLQGDVNVTPDGRLFSFNTDSNERGAWLIDPTTWAPLEAAALGLDQEGRGGWLSFADATGHDQLNNGSQVQLAPSGRRAVVIHRRVSAVVVELGTSPDSGVLTLRGHAGASGETADGWIYHLAMSHDGSLAASAAPLDPFVRVWDTRTGEPLAHLERGPCVANSGHTSTHDALMAFTPDGGRLVVTTPYEGSDSRVVVWDPITGEVELPSTPMASSSDHTLVLLDRFLDAAHPGPHARLSQRVHTLEGETWAGLARPNSYWMRECPDPGSRWRYVPARGEVAGISVHPERPHIALVRNSQYWGIGEEESHWIYNLTDEPYTDGSVPQQRELLVVLDARTGERLVEHELEAQPWCAAYSPDGSLLAVGTHEGRVLFFETEHYQQQLDWPAHDSYVYSLAWTPDGTRLVTASGDATLRVWDSRPRIVAQREDDAWRALRASMAAREDLAEVYPTLEGSERAAARAELIVRRAAR